MIKRTVEISSAPAQVTVKRSQLVLNRDGETVGSIPCEDLGMVVVDHPGTTYSHAALTSLLDFDAALVVCGRDHLPKGMLLPFADHSQVVWRIDEQISASAPLKKRLWKQLVQAKILAQAENLAHDSPPYRKLLQFAREVRSGDTTNREAQAAKVYWQSWLVNVPETNSPLPQEEGPGGEESLPSPSGRGAGGEGNLLDGAFRRQPDGSPPNGLLNYGYAILRAAVARALVAAGLLPALGLQHSHRANAFCLADDLLEPLRPLVDRRVRELYWSGVTEPDRESKQVLLELLTETVLTAGRTGPLMVSLHRMAASLVKCYEGSAKELEIPTRCKSADTVACGS